MTNLVCLALLLWPLFDARCASGPKPKPALPEGIARISGDPARHVGRVVTLNGVFQGFRVAGCRFPGAASPTGLTRRDWLFRTGDDCLYVTGGAPSGLEPIDPGYVGRRLELKARVSGNETGKVYLEFVEGRLLKN